MSARTAFACIAIALAVALALAGCGRALPTVNPAVPGETSAPAPTATPTQTPTATPVATHHALAEFGPAERRYGSLRKSSAREARISGGTGQDAS